MQVRDGTLEGGEDPGEAHRSVSHRLSHAPHHGMDWHLFNKLKTQSEALCCWAHHAKVGMFVHKGNRARGEKPQGEGDDQAHHQDHHAVKPEKKI